MITKKNKGIRNKAKKGKAKVFDAKKYFGKIKVENPLEFQKKLRDEWE